MLNFARKCVVMINIGEVSKTTSVHSVLREIKIVIGVMMEKGSAGHVTMDLN